MAERRTEAAKFEDRFREPERGGRSAKGHKAGVSAPALRGKLDYHVEERPGPGPDVRRYGQGWLIPKIRGPERHAGADWTVSSHKKLRLTHLAQRGGSGMARRSPPLKVTYFEPVPPRLAHNTIIESTFDVGRRYRCTMRVDCGQLDPSTVIRPKPGELHPRSLSASTKGSLRTGAPAVTRSTNCRFDDRRAPRGRRRISPIDRSAPNRPQSLLDNPLGIGCCCP
jgi:hypothetical protein